MKPFLRLFFFCIILMHLGSASTMAHDGTVYIVGTVKSKTCIISPDSENLIVRMSDVATGQFTNQKNNTPWEHFAINLENCGTGLNNISTHFEGTPNQGNADLLSLTGGPGYASGVAIGIYNPDKTLIPLGDESQLFTLSNNQLTATLDFYARYLADGGAVSPGTANAAATFILTYA